VRGSCLRGHKVVSLQLVGYDCHNYECGKAVTGYIGGEVGPRVRRSQRRGDRPETCTVR